MLVIYGTVIYEINSLLKQSIYLFIQHICPIDGVCKILRHRIEYIQPGEFFQGREKQA